MSSLLSSYASPATPRARRTPSLVLDGKYRIEGTLGTGGMGTVYDGVNIAIGRRVAIKVLHARYARFPELVERFEREASAAARIGHPNIVDVLDLGRADGVPYIVMEHLEGEGLYDRLGRGVLAPAEATAILLQILDALEAAHAAGIVHRDLKPENVFLAHRADGGYMVKVLDFGVAKFSGTDHSSRLTIDGFVVGTPSYMSPEQAAGLPSVDARTDVYSAGVLMYELLSGSLPYEGTDPARLLRTIISRPPRPLREMAPSVPAALARLVDKAMQRAPEERYPTAGAFLEALRELAPEAARGTPANLVFSRPARWSSTNRVRALASTCAVPDGQSPLVAFDRDPTVTAVTDALLRRSLRRRSFAAIATVGGLLLGLLAFHRLGEGLDPAALALTAGREHVALTSPAAPPPTTVPLSVTSNVPGARVSIDGRLIGSAPVERVLAKIDGARLVRIEADGYVAAEQWVRADSAGHVDLTLAPVPAATPTPSITPRRSRSAPLQLPFERVY